MRNSVIQSSSALKLRESEKKLKTARENMLIHRLQNINDHGMNLRLIMTMAILEMVRERKPASTMMMMDSPLFLTSSSQITRMRPTLIGYHRPRASPGWNV